MTITEIHEFISKQQFGVLSTISPEGIPQSALIGFAVTPKLEIIFDTVSSARKFRNLTTDPRCSFVTEWAGEITVQYEGVAFQPEAAALSQYQQIYFAKWPDGARRLAWTGLTHFVIRPNWIRYSDFNKRPPLIEEFRLP